MHEPKTNRRDLLKQSGLALSALSVAGPALAGGSCLLTPAQTSGPYYPEIPSSEWEDADLTSFRGGTGVAKGTPLLLYGRVFANESCAPLAGALVEIWQADDHGRYKHSRDDQTVPLDPGFQYFGKIKTDASGVYKFKTIVPGKYPGRTRHIHIRVVTPDRQQLVTQLYFENFQQENLKDGIFLSLYKNGLAERVTAKIVRDKRLNNLARVQFDMAISGSRKVPAL